jgi:hypothetical protein
LGGRGLAKSFWAFFFKEIPTDCFPGDFGEGDDAVDLSLLRILRDLSSSELFRDRSRDDFLLVSVFGVFGDLLLPAPCDLDRNELPLGDLGDFDLEDLSLVDLDDSDLVDKSLIDLGDFDLKDLSLGDLGDLDLDPLGDLDRDAFLSFFSFLSFDALGTFGDLSLDPLGDLGALSIDFLGALGDRSFGALGDFSPLDLSDFSLMGWTVEGIIVSLRLWLLSAGLDAYSLSSGFFGTERDRVRLPVTNAGLLRLRLRLFWPASSLVKTLGLLLRPSRPREVCLALLFSILR